MNDDEFKLKVMESLGGINAKLDNHTNWMTAHVAEDKIMADDIKKIQLSGARQKGFAAAIGTAGGVLGAVAAIAADFFGSRGSH